MPREPRRVWITGIGVVTAAGIGRDPVAQLTSDAMME